MIQTNVDAQTISEFLGVNLHGNNLDISQPASLNSIVRGSVTFANKYSDEICERLNKFEEITAIVIPEYSDKLNCSYLVVSNPRLEFARILQEFFVKTSNVSIAETAIIGQNVSLGANVKIGEYVVIGNNVSIADGTEIRNHVVINDRTIIGSNCLIRSHTVIGEEGFGFDFDTEGRPIRFPHVGIVEIGNNVEIGASNTIARATLDKTIIHNYVKTDDRIHIAHNVVIGENTVITACAEISGSVTIGKNVWISPNASIINNIEIGDNSMIGIGAVVTKNVPENYLATGNPAKKIKKLT